ncbi:MAG: hypothetical protein F4226_01730 [Synechococcus sp. SB0678_bin_12]|nr:hypothetical protein [Synechococcus sp. SB0678_bin_12]
MINESSPKKPKPPMPERLFLILAALLAGILVGHGSGVLNIINFQFLLSAFQGQGIKQDPEQSEIAVAGTSPSDEVTGKEENLTGGINNGVYPDSLAALPSGQCLRLASSDITSSIWQELPSVVQVVRDAEKKEQAMDYANAASFFNEANAHIRKNAPENTDNQHQISDYKRMTIYTELRVYENSIKALDNIVSLDISNPIRCDPDQRKYVMTPEMVAVVEGFQKRTGIPTTGDLDFETMQELITALPHSSSSDNWSDSSSS